MCSSSGFSKAMGPGDSLFAHLEEDAFIKSFHRDSSTRVYVQGKWTGRVEAFLNVLAINMIFYPRVHFISGVSDIPFLSWSQVSSLL